MKPSAHIASLIELIEEVTAFKQPADQVFSTYTRKRRYIGSKDRRQLGSWLYDILRSYAKLSYHAHDPLTLVLAYLKLSLGWSPKDILSNFKGEAYGPKKLGSNFKAWLEELEEEPLPEYLQYECPEWLWESLKDKKKALSALKEEAPCDIRTNSLKTTRDKLIKALKAENIKTLPLSSEYALRINGRHQLMTLPVFKKGHFEIQDLGSQEIINLCKARPGEMVIDLCAGGGGKALGLAADMKNKGKILACDVVPFKLKNTDIRMRRAGVNIHQSLMLDERGRKKLNVMKGQADLVLVDAPCSGTGTWRRNPDLRWRLKPAELQKLLKTQVQLLDQASKLVKPGGRLVYATCSILPQENSIQIERFLKSHLAFTPLDRVELTPPNSDGFFAQAMIKESIC